MDSCLFSSILSATFPFTNGIMFHPFKQTEYQEICLIPLLFLSQSSCPSLRFYSSAFCMHGDSINLHRLKKHRKFGYVYKNKLRYVTENPFLYIDYKKLNMRKARRKKSTEKAFSKTESKDIYEVAFEDFKRGRDCVPLAVAFTFHTGLRSGEVVALKWEDVNLDNKTMVVQRLERQYQITDDFRKLGKHVYEIEKDTKGSFGDRPIELSDKAVEILLELKDFYKRKGIESEWIFTHKADKIHYRARKLPGNGH